MNQYVRLFRAVNISGKNHLDNTLLKLVILISCFVFFIYLSIVILFDLIIKIITSYFIFDFTFDSIIKRALSLIIVFMPQR